MFRLTSALALALLAFSFAHAEDASEAGLLAELKKLAAPLDPAKTVDMDAEDLRELLHNKGKHAMKIIVTFEEEFPKSKSLNVARLYALAAASRSEQLAVAEQPIALAKRLREATEKGSDQAAQADLFLVAAEIRKTLRGARSGEAFRTAWNKNADTFRKKIADYLEDHPKYAPAADALRNLVPLLELAGDTKTRDLIIEKVAKNLPDHPLARAAALRRAVGQNFDVKFKAVGSDKEVSLKDLRGKVVVVHFWASWCVPCQAELRQLQQLHEKYHKDGLVIVGFSLDEKDAAAERFIKRHMIPWAQVIGDQARALGDKLGIETIPVELVIDREGKLHSADAVGRLPDLLPKLLGKEEK